jgi:flap endonuclease-1
MGVDLSSILDKQELSLSEVQGRVAIDAFNTLYQFLTIIRQKDGTPLMDSKGRITSHLSGLFYRTCNLLEKGIRPVYVFDGEPHPLKKQTIAERGARKLEAEEELRKAREEGRAEDVRVYAQQTARLGEEQVDESKRLLDLLGVPWVQAPSEGEAQCAWLCREGLVQAAGSQDYDSLLFGTPVLIRNLTVAGRRKLPRREVYVDVLPERIDLEANLTRLNLTRRKLVWLALLVGTDFNPGVHGIGPKKGLKLVQENDSMESILKKLSQEMDWKTLESVFLKPDVKEINKKELEAKELDREGLVKFMVDEHDFSLDRTNSTLERAFQAPADTSQASLKKWF